MERKHKSGMGGGCIVTLTGWTHPLHTNTKRKCVSILCIPEASLMRHAGQGKKTKEWDGRGAHSYTDGMDSQTAHKHKEKMC